jgi:hypothetical protein
MFWFTVAVLSEVTKEWEENGENYYDSIVVTKSKPVFCWREKLGLKKKNPWVYFNFDSVTLKAHQKYAHTRRPATWREILDMFISEVMKSLRTAGCWAFKIPDMPQSFIQNVEGMRFNPPKPCDIVSCYRGSMVAIECKLMKKISAFGMKQIRPSQVENLEKVSNAGGAALIFLNVRVSANKTLGIKRMNRLIPFVWNDFKKITENGIIRGKDLPSLQYIEGYKGEFKLGEYLDVVTRRS